MDYREAGVDVSAGRAFVERIQQYVESTHRVGVLGGVGGFGGFFEVPSGYTAPVLVSGTDGVGTKLKVAQALAQHETIGIDLVAMCVNDVLTSGAEPLFFLDYLATGQLEPEQLGAVVKGIAVGCQQANCALIGGETAEMPGFYSPGEYDLAGFCVGIVEKARLLNGSQVQVGDRVIGLASQGVHSNGYSLVRKIMAGGVRRDLATLGYEWQECPEILGGRSLGETLLSPTQIYVQPVLRALRSGLEIHSMAHITGGGLPENLPRCLRSGQSIRLEPGSWPVLPIFEWLAAAGQVPLVDMFDTFNMGIGYGVIVPQDMADAAISHFQKEHLSAYAIGEVVAGDRRILGIPTR
jgi:phosphoribosylformylglycinamidine cyclo-ligase